VDTGAVSRIDEATEVARAQVALWRTRVRLVDDPGALASLTTRLAERGCNLLGLSVLPVAPEREDEPASVVDELVLAAPGSLTPQELADIVADANAKCIGVVPASASELVDAPTDALRDAVGVLSGAVRAADAVGRLLRAESIECAPGNRGTSGEEIVVDEDGTRAHIAIDGSIITVRRRWAPFTDIELARISALLDLLAAAPLPEGTPTDRRARRQLSSLDVQFLNAETTASPTHIGSLTVLDPSERPGGPITIGELRRRIASRLHLVTPLRWRLHTVPFGLDLPYWLDSGAVDIARHVHEVEVAAPGTDRQLADLIAELAAQPLQRDLPLWHAFLIHGLEGGRQALYTKVHHAVIDGVSGAEILAVVLDIEPNPTMSSRPPSVVVPETPPRAGEMASRAVRNAVRAATRFARRGPALISHLSDLPGAASVPLAGAFANLTRSPRPISAPRTSLNQSVGQERSFAFTSLPLADVKQVRATLGLTVNDVVMALCTTAVRRWLIGAGGLPATPLVAGIPVSVRSTAELGAGGNRISFLLAPLPTDVADPLHRARMVQQSVSAAKRRFAEVPSELLDDAVALLPQLLHGLLPRAALSAAASLPPAMNLLVSNVPGPQIPLYAAGARVVANHPVSVVHDLTGALNITVMSYNGHLDIGVVACRRAVPDAWTITDHLRSALDELLELSIRSAS
jgi:diacylglycerol O-acyltransferase / wax synthase